MAEYELVEVYHKVRGLILESLDKPDRDCNLSTSLIDDLGAESLDYLDVAFRIERTFNVKVQRGRVEKDLRARYPQMTVKPNTDANDDLKAVLKEIMPEVDPERIEAISKVKDVARLFTVATFVRVAVQAIRETRPDSTFKAHRIEGYEPQQLGVLAVSAQSEEQARV